MADTIDERRRLQALAGTGLLDTAPSPAFDRYTRLASIITGAPIALISLIDENRQWFKSCIGLDVSETPREYAFCDHAIRHPGLFVITDASTDARFYDNPLVTGAPHIRFYAGAPLTLASGDTIGTLCVIDTKARRDGLPDAQASALMDLAATLVSAIDADQQARRREVAIGELQHRIGNMFGQVAGLVMLAQNSGQTKDEYIADLRARIEALSHLNQQLAKRDWTASAMPDVVRAAILPIIAGRQDRLELRGPALDVKAKSAMTLSLLLSELAVNSLKHGTLGRDDGQVVISWLVRDSAFELTWREPWSGAAAPGTGRMGFGTSLLTNIGPRDLGGSADYRLLSDELVYRLVADIDRVRSV